jgi:pyruvate/2-oxoglutarate/acetoin dehydrogenase E1 component
LYVEALREAIAEEMRRDGRVFVLGEDVRFAYTFAVTKGLVNEFGEERVRDTPISENGIVGVAVGAALAGMRPIAEIQFEDLILLAMDQLVNQAAKMRYMSGGQARVPMVVRTPGGFWGSFGPHHSQNLEAIFMHTPGLKVAVPSTAYDAKGLLKTAVRGEDPVLFLEHKRLYQMPGEVPDEEYVIPFGSASVRREGNDVTIVATQLMVHRALEAVEKLATKGIQAEIIDPRTIVPLDKKTILSSVEKTGRLVIVEEGCQTGGIGAEIAAIVAEERLSFLDAPIRRIGVPDTPIPFSPPLEEQVIPDTNRIVKTVTELFH